MDTQIIELLRNPVDIQDLSDERLENWILQYPFLSILHHEKVLRAILQNAPDKEKLMHMGALHAKDLKQYGIKVFHAINAMSIHEDRIDVESDESTFLFNPSEDYLEDHGIVLSPEVASEQRYLSDEELADEITEDLNEREWDESNSISIDEIVESEYTSHDLVTEQNFDQDTDLISIITAESAQTESESEQTTSFDNSRLPDVQLEEFTAWLQSLKQLERPSDAPLSAREVTTKNLSVISVSLAEILMKQGHNKEAIDMYKKLSLKYPEKSDYFALQIDKILSS